MKNFTQELINGIDKTNEHGLTEALLIAISSVKNKDGLLVNLKLCEDFNEHIDYVKQVARMILDKKET